MIVHTNIDAHILIVNVNFCSSNSKWTKEWFLTVNFKISTFCSNCIHKECALCHTVHTLPHVFSVVALWPQIHKHAQVIAIKHNQTRVPVCNDLKMWSHIEICVSLWDSQQESSAASTSNGLLFYQQLVWRLHRDDWTIKIGLHAEGFSAARSKNMTRRRQRCSSTLFPIENNAFFCLKDVNVKHDKVPS